MTDTAPQEPSCYVCGGSGGPCCGPFDPAALADQKAVAERIILDRARCLAFTAPTVATEIDAVVLDVPPEHARRISALVQAARVRISITWPDTPDPGPGRDLPF